MASDKSWKKIFTDHGVTRHDFAKGPFYLSAAQIKRSCQQFKETSEKEVRILCKQDTRSDRPSVFIENNLFILPVRNGHYALIQGEGYIDIPPIEDRTLQYTSKLPFDLETSRVGNSEMQHLDFAYASSIIRTFMQDDSLVLTIRGRKYTPAFSFRAGNHKIDVAAVQTEVDAGYEGKDRVVLIEAKQQGITDTIIRQLYYPFRQWSEHTSKKVDTLFFCKSSTGNRYMVWHYGFSDAGDYNSIKLIKAQTFEIR